MKILYISIMIMTAVMLISLQGCVIGAVVGGAMGGMAADMKKCEGMVSPDGGSLSPYECSYIMSPPNNCPDRGGCD